MSEQANGLAQHVRDVINFMETKLLAKDEHLFHRKLREWIETKNK